MSDDQNLSVREWHIVGSADLRKHSGWFIGVGAVLIVFGIVALSSSVLVTLGTMIVIGWLMIMAGVVQTLHGITRRGGTFFVDLLAGILSTVTGILIVGHPGATAGALTLMIAMLLIIGGIFRIAVAVSVRFVNMIWLFIHGVLNMLLAVIILQDWPVSGLWVIGTFIAIDMIFSGWTLVMLGITARRLP